MLAAGKDVAESRNLGLYTLISLAQRCACGFPPLICTGTDVTDACELPEASKHGSRQGTRHVAPATVEVQQGTQPLDNETKADKGVEALSRCLEALELAGASTAATSDNDK